MNTLKRCCIYGLIFVWIAGFFFHFIYDLSGQNKFFGLFFPVNESTWEHMKLIFFPMFLSAVPLYKKLSADYPCLLSAILTGTLAGTFAVPVLFYTYTGIWGTNLFVLDILTFLLSAAFGYVLIYRLSASCGMNRYLPILFLLTLGMLAGFLIFTYAPPGIGLFVNPV